MTNAFPSGCFIVRMLWVSIILLSIMTLQPAQAAPVRSVPQLQLLQDAREALGGQALEDVTSLSIDYIREGSGFDLVLPDKFRHRTRLMGHLIDGSSFRQTRDLPAETRSSAHVRTEFMFAAAAIKYLLAVPSILDIKVAQASARDVAPFGRVNVLRFTGKRGFDLELFLDRSSDLPRGSAYLFPMQGDRLELITASFENYRTVDGVRFPFRTTSTQGGHPHTSEIATVRVNPDDLEGVFGRQN